MAGVGAARRRHRPTIHLVLLQKFIFNQNQLIYPIGTLGLCNNGKFR